MKGLLIMSAIRASSSPGEWTPAFDEGWGAVSLHTVLRTDPATQNALGALPSDALTTSTALEMWDERGGLTPGAPDVMT